MGLFGALGKALKAPVKAVGKLPGMGSVGKVVGSVPGVNPMMNKIGLGPSNPQAVIPKLPPMNAPQPMMQGAPPPIAQPPVAEPDMGVTPQVMPQTEEMPIAQGAPMGQPKIGFGQFMQNYQNQNPQRRGMGSFVTNRMRTPRAQ